MKFFVAVLLLLLIFFMIFAMRGNTVKDFLTQYVPFLFQHQTEKVLSYKPDMEKELKKYRLEKYTPLLLAIMYQESRGEGQDLMQASESAGLKRNEIQDKQESIRQGVYHFYQMYHLGIQNKVDLNTIIQSYNMGPGYIKFVASNGSMHTEELAKEYSKMQVENHPKLYTCGGFKGNFRYPYCFGDYTYAEKVETKLEIVKKNLEK
ncbi:lysozyme family protein [Bacillus sp. FJAT-49736]|uniref:lysozyme family protein n=1 Tax=Bacillus sp. FJAT-49736 TaxID=2833582 RepID=UPI001BC9064D|nr:lysozyme family protein [Bacillus sp. FJAT-49736]MBS4174569.1 lysozyme family protein [Bacillus sp. FJAT-49736]